ncbi:MAG: phosphotriesterase [Chloroflexi bacterium]|nr:phosphotriesterase [Chloroflexota bacterium]
MATISTVTGEVAPEDLGVTLFHEHLAMVSPGLELNWPQAFDRPAEVENAVELLSRAAAVGVRTLVDLTTIDLGRDITMQQQIGERSEVQIVVCTGVHLRPSRFLLHAPDERIVELFVDDIERGIGGTSIRAGALKIASAEEVTEENERLLRLIARAHLATGVPIITHSEALTESGARQQEVFADEGVDLTQVAVGHVGDTTDLDYLERLAARGSFVGMDRFGLDVVLPVAERIEVVAALCTRGLEASVLLSHDAATSYDALPRGLELPDHPLWKFTTIHEVVLPALRERGVSESQIETMLVDNPRRLLTPVAPA